MRTEGGIQWWFFSYRLPLDVRAGLAPHARVSSPAGTSLEPHRMSGCNCASSVIRRWEGWEGFTVSAFKGVGGQIFDKEKEKIEVESHREGQFCYFWKTRV